MSALGQKRKFDTPKVRPFQRQLQSETCQTVYTNDSDPETVGVLPKLNWLCSVLVPLVAIQP